jgi:hypothetical protein
VLLCVQRRARKRAPKLIAEQQGEVYHCEPLKEVKKCRSSPLHLSRYISPSKATIDPPKVEGRRARRPALRSPLLAQYELETIICITALPRLSINNPSAAAALASNHKATEAEAAHKASGAAEERRIGIAGAAEAVLGVLHTLRS